MGGVVGLPRVVVLRRHEPGLALWCDEVFLTLLADSFECFDTVVGVIGWQHQLAELLASDAAHLLLLHGLP